MDFYCMGISDPLNSIHTVIWDMYDTILVATDGTGSANRAVTYALEQADHSGARLHAVYVVDADRYAKPANGTASDEPQGVKERGNRILEEVTERAQSLGTDAVTQYRNGKPYEEILRYSDEIDADLIVVGYRGHSPGESSQISGMTDRVMKNSGRPVLVV